MNPYYDETLVLILSASLEEISRSRLHVNALRESSSHTYVEGICHEVCYLSKLGGPGPGLLFLGMDKYAHSLLLPYLPETGPESDLILSDSVTVNYFQEIIELTLRDLRTAYPGMQFGLPEVMHNRLIALPKDDYRKYRMIFFIKDAKGENYLGRIYLTLALSKNKT